MAILNTQQAKQLGRLGGQASAAARKGDREWGRRAQRQRAAAIMHRAYPGLTRLWAINANRARWGRPLELLPDVKRLMTPPVSEIRVRVGNDEQP